MYYYYPPIKPQYFFQKNIDEIPSLLNFYKPYSFKSKIVWFLWKKHRFVRNKFIINDEDLPVEMSLITNFTGEKKYIFCINKGTPSIEQKSSIAVFEKNGKPKWLLKYSKKEKARELSNNEIKVLKQLPNSEMFPKLINYYISNEFTIFMTSFLKGLKISNIELTKKLVNLILDINLFKIQGFDYKKSPELLYSFAHGDFFPGNLIIDNIHYKIFDWEMAGTYPLGYDLFSYIFQTNFLLKKNNIATIIKKCSQLIEYYFQHYNLKDWLPYIKEFANIKISIESKKENKNLYKKYLKLVDFLSEKNAHIVNT